MTSNLRRAAAVALTATLATGIAATPAQAAPGDRNYIKNVGTVSVGVIHIYDDVYTNGNYDQLLDRNERSDQVFGWSQTHGYYMGSGYCMRIWAKYPNEPDSAFRLNPLECDAGLHTLPTDHVYRIEAYR